MKSQRTWTRFLCLVAAAGLAITVFGCEGGGGAKKEEVVTQTPDLADGRPPELIGNGIVYGKVIDAQTGKGLGGVEVKLLIGNVHTLTTTTADAAAAAAPDAAAQKAQSVSYAGTALDAGGFEFQQIPAGTHILTLSKAGFASKKLRVKVDASSDPVYVLVMEGPSDVIKMDLGVEVQVVVTKAGAAMPNVLVNIDSRDWAMEFNATTDANGIASFPGLSQRAAYTVYVFPQDTDGDGLVDFVTAMAPYSYKVNQKTVTVDLQPLRPGTKPDLKIANCEVQLVDVDADDAGPGDCDIPAGEPIRLVSKIPVEITGTVQLSAKDLVAQFLPLARGAETPTSEIAMTAEPSAENVLWTLTPSSPLKEGYTYSLSDKAIEARIKYTKENKLVEEEFSLPSGIYVIPAAQLAVGAIFLDNYNSKIGHQKLVWIKFPKQVYGNVVIKKYTQAGAEKIFDGSAANKQPKTIPLILDRSCATIADHVQLVSCDGRESCGCLADGTTCGTAALNYRCPLRFVEPGALPDALVVTFDNDGVGGANSITLDINVTDSAGTVVSQEVTLPVK